MTETDCSVVVVGSFNVDHVWQCEALPKPGETLSGAYRTGPGGKGFNQAVAARRAGAEVVFVCALGDDAGAQLAWSLAETDGIELRQASSTAPTGTAGIYVDAAGRNSIVIGPGANAALDEAFVAAQAGDISRASVVVTQLETPLDGAAAALRTARASGAIALLNPAPANADVPATLLALVDVLTPNETEFTALLARHDNATDTDAGAIATLDDARLHALCRTLLPHGTVVVTLGEAGCFVSHAADNARGDDTDCYRAAATPAQVVDTTGAGDAFNGALAASLALRPSAAFGEHIAFASRYAARSTETEGAAAAMPKLAPSR